MHTELITERRDRKVVRNLGDLKRLTMRLGRTGKRGMRVSEAVAVEVETMVLIQP